MGYLCPSCKQEVSSRRYLHISTIHPTRPSSFPEQSLYFSHLHTLARFVLFLSAPFFASPSTTRASLPESVLSSSFGHSTILIAILASSSDSSVFFQGTPIDPLLILAAPNSSTFNPFFLQVLDLRSQTSNSLSSLLDDSLLP